MTSFAAKSPSAGRPCGSEVSRTLPLSAWEPVGLRNNLLRWWESGPNIPDFSLRRPTMRLKIMTICPRSPTVLVTIA